MPFGTRVGFEPLRSSGFAAIGATYTALGPALTHACRILRLVNDTNGDVIISYDGINDEDFVPSNSFVLYDFTSDQVQQDGFFLREGTVIFQKAGASAPTSGTLYGVVVVASAGGV
jgi:hypothetical protein